MNTATDGALALAIAQFAPTSDRAANLARIAEMTADAAAQGAHVIVFPEYSSFFVAPFDASLAAHAEPLDGPFVTALTEIAARHAVVVVAGLLERASDATRVRNTVVAVSAAGRLAVYRKLHLYDAFGQRESDWVEPGERGSRDFRGSRHPLRYADVLRPEIPRDYAPLGRCRRARRTRAGGVGARPAEGAPLADAHHRSRDREHDVHGGGRSPAADRRWQQHDRRSGGRCARHNWDRQRRCDRKGAT